MSALHIKLSVYIGKIPVGCSVVAGAREGYICGLTYRRRLTRAIDTVDTPPVIVIVARSSEGKQIAINGLMSETTTINILAHPGVVLEVHIDHVDAAATLVADEKEAKDQGMPYFVS